MNPNKKSNTKFSTFMLVVSISIFFVAISAKCEDVQATYKKYKEVSKDIADNEKNQQDLKNEQRDKKKELSKLSSKRSPAPEQQGDEMNCKNDDCLRMASKCNQDFPKDSKDSFAKDLIDTKSKLICFSIFENKKCWNDLSGDDQSMATNSCWKVADGLQITALKDRLREIELALGDLKKENNDLVKDKEDIVADCPACEAAARQEDMLNQNKQFKSFSFGGGGQTGPSFREPNIGDYIVAGLQVATPLALGGIQAYYANQAAQGYANAYSSSYQNYVNYANQAGLPINAPTPFGGGFGSTMGMGGMNPYLYSGIMGGTSLLGGLLGGGGGGGGGLYLGANLGANGMGYNPYGGMGYGSGGLMMSPYSQMGYNPVMMGGYPGYYPQMGGQMGMPGMNGGGGLYLGANLGANGMGYNPYGMGFNGNGMISPISPMGGFGQMGGYNPYGGMNGGGGMLISGGIGNGMPGLFPYGAIGPGMNGGLTFGMNGGGGGGFPMYGPMSGGYNPSIFSSPISGFWGSPLAGGGYMDPSALGMMGMSNPYGMMNPYGNGGLNGGLYLGANLGANGMMNPHGSMGMNPYGTMGLTGMYGPTSPYGTGLMGQFSPGIYGPSMNPYMGGTGMMPGMYPSSYTGMMQSPFMSSPMSGVMMNPYGGGGYPMSMNGFPGMSGNGFGSMPMYGSGGMMNPMIPGMSGFGPGMMGGQFGMGANPSLIAQSYQQSLQYQQQQMQAYMQQIQQKQAIAQQMTGVQSQIQQLNQQYYSLYMSMMTGGTTGTTSTLPTCLAGQTTGCTPPGTTTTTPGFTPTNGSVRF